MEARPDLLAWIDRLARSPDVRRAERWRVRGRTGAWIAEEANRVAADLAGAGVAPGDRVAIHLPDGPLWHAAFFGILRAGAVAVPLEGSLDPDLLARRAGELGVRAWCAGGELPPLPLDHPRVDLGGRSRLPPGDPPALPDPDPGRVAEIVLTSGTSGTPDAVEVTHANLRAVLDALDGAVAPYRWALRALPPMRLAVALPLSHLYGQVMGVFVPALLGARATIVAPLAAPDLARVARREKAWALATVPRTLDLLAGALRARAEARWGAAGFARRLDRARGHPWWRRRFELRAVRAPLGRRLLAVVSGGADLDPETESFWRAIGIAVVQGYGLTETAPLVTLTHPLRPSPGSLGAPLPGVEMTLAGDGEILVRGPNVAPAREGGPTVDAEGWLHTGDLGRLDAEGRLRFAGRKGERIVTPAGTNVDPAPVVAALRARPAIADAVVLERPWGERGAVAAVILARPGGDVADAVRSANATLPDASRVRDWHLWPGPDFPRTRTGKPRHGALADWLADRAPRPGATPADAPAPDADAAVVRAVARIGALDPGRLDATTPIGEVLGSLDRIELATRLESTFGVSLPERAFAAERTIAEVADALARPATGPAPSAPGPGSTPEVPRPTAPPTDPGTRRVPRAEWRAALPTRVARFVLMEGLVRPAWRSLIDLDAGGVENVTALDPPFLIAANHASEFDPGPILYGVPRRVRRRLATTAMWEYFEDARTGRLLYAVAVLGLDLVPLVQKGDWRPTLEIAGRVADRGGCPIVFPEGERSPDGELLGFRPGVAVMARDLHLPIVPCAISGLLAVLPKGAHWPRGCWRSRAKVAVRFGAAIPAPRPDAEPDPVVALLRKRIAALHADSRAAAGRD